MQIRVIEIGAVESQSKGKNRWQQIVVKYHGDKGEKERTVRSFEADVFNAFKNDIKPGDTVDVKVVKEGDYWNWKQAVVVEGNDNAINNQAEKGTTKSAVSAQGGTKKVGDWETAEERAAKQRYIVRQSSLATAIDFFNLRGNRDAGVAEVINVAQTFERHVFGEVAVEEKQPRKRAAKADAADPIE